MSLYLRTAAKLAFGLWLTAAFALAPAAGMARHCSPASGHQTISHGEKAPAHTPCKHCDDDGQRQLCKSHCSGMTVSIAPSDHSFESVVSAARVVVHGTVAPGDFLRSPDTPPPRSFPV